MPRLPLSSSGLGTDCLELCPFGCDLGDAGVVLPALGHDGHPLNVVITLEDCLVEEVYKVFGFGGSLVVLLAGVLEDNLVECFPLPQ